MNVKLRRWLLDWHMYVGLLCAPYFVLYGVSTILFNHHISGERVITHWERSLEAPVQSERRYDRATEARAALDLGGTVPRWRVKDQPDGTLDFFVTRPGRSYDVSLSADGTHARIKETDGGLTNVLRGMHGAVASDGMAWTWIWAVYTDVTVVGLAFAVASGLYLWWPKKRQRAWGIAGIVGGSAIWIGVWSWLW